MIAPVCKKCFTTLNREVVREARMGNVTTNILRVSCPCCGHSHEDYDVAYQASDGKARLERERQSARARMKKRQRSPKVYFRRS